MGARGTSAGGLLLSLAVLGGAVGRLPADDAKPELTREAKQRVIRTAAHVLVEGYIHEDVARRMAERIEATFEAGGYDGLRTPDEFASKLTEDLRAVSKDRHLGI